MGHDRCCVIGMLISIPDKLIASSNNTASGQTSSKEFITEETYSLAFGGSIPAMHITTTKTFFSVLTKFTDKTYI